MDGGRGRPAGPRPELKSKPQASQNWPERPVPQFGHDCAPGGADSGAVPADVTPPGGPDGAAAAGAGVPIRIPQVSQ